MSNELYKTTFAEFLDYIKDFDDEKPYIIKTVSEKNLSFAECYETSNAYTKKDFYYSIFFIYLADLFRGLISITLEEYFDRKYFSESVKNIYYVDAEVQALVENQNYDYDEVMDCINKNLQKHLSDQLVIKFT